MQRNAMKYEVQARKQIYTRNNTMTTHHALDATRRMGESMMCGDRRFSTVYYYFFRRLCACMFGLEASLCFVKERIWFCMRHRFSSSHTVLSSTFNRSFFLYWGGIDVLNVIVHAAIEHIRMQIAPVASRNFGVGCGQWRTSFELNWQSIAAMNYNTYLHIQDVHCIHWHRYI